MNNKLPSIINGCWQLSDGHTLKTTSRTNMTNMTKLLFRYLDAGLTTFDCADIYCGVEERLGLLRQEALREGYSITVHTKYVPNRDTLHDLTPQKIENALVASLKKLKTTTLDLVQFHWWDYAAGDYLRVLEALKNAQEKGLIKDIGLTNFNGEHLQRILRHGIKIYSLQTQYSFLDKRLEKSVLAIAQENAINIFCYGVLAGGFFSDQWLNIPEPSVNALKNRSLIKYLLIIQEYGGWSKFQALLNVLSNIAQRISCSIAEVVVMYFVNYTKIDAVILGMSRDFQRNPLENLTHFALTDAEEASIQDAFNFFLPGDLYDLERNSVTHASIMKYNLNQS